MKTGFHFYSIIHSPSEMVFFEPFLNLSIKLVTTSYTKYSTPKKRLKEKVSQLYYLTIRRSYSSLSLRIQVEGRRNSRQRRDGPKNEGRMGSFKLTKQRLPKFVTSVFVFLQFKLNLGKNYFEISLKVLVCFHVITNTFCF